MRILNPYQSPLLKKNNRGKILNGGLSTGSSAIANYPFTSDLLDTVSGTSLVYTVIPTIDAADGITCAAATVAKVDMTGFPANDYKLTFTLKANTSTGGALGMTVCIGAWSSGALMIAYVPSTGSFRVYKGSATTVLEVTGFGSLNSSGRVITLEYEQSATDGATLTCTEIGGLGASGTDADAASTGDTTGSYLQLAEDSAGALDWHGIEIKDLLVDSL